MEHTSKKGLITALSCYIIWGLLPLYWALLNHVSPYNILAQRIIWSGVCMAIVVFGLHFKQFKKDFQLLKEQRSQLFLLLIAAVIISVNWFTYIWAIAKVSCAPSNLTTAKVSSLTLTMLGNHLLRNIFKEC